MSETQGSTIYLTKSDFLRFRTCPAYCWTSKYRRDLIPPDPEDVQRRMDDGNMVEAFARKLYPDGVLVDEWNAAEATRATEQAIADGASTIFQASVLTTSGLHARADVLERDPAGRGWTIIEIKSSTSASFDNRKDVTFQRIAFAEAGYNIRSVQIMHLNRDYCLNGRVELDALFRYDGSVMAWADARLEETLEEIQDAISVVLDGEVCPPCSCDRVTRGKRCPTFSVFHPDFPSGDTVYELISINDKRLTEVLDRGVLHLRDWPADVKLSAKQRWQIETVRSGRERVARDRLAAFLAGMQRPFYFLDYETVQTPVPLFSGTRPYQQIPFQYSLHVLDENDDLHHREFFWAKRGHDPIRPLVEALRTDIGDEGSVLVWWKGFEGKRNEEMAAAVPELEDFLLGLNTRMVDLMDSVTKGMWVHPEFRGSAAIKKVLPVVAPDLDYALLEIGNGSLATLRWKQCVIDDAPPEGIDVRAVLAALREYCHQDTLAMVRIWQHLSHLAGVEPVSMSPIGSRLA